MSTWGVHKSDGPKSSLEPMTHPGKMKQPGVLVRGWAGKKKLEAEKQS